MHTFVLHHVLTVTANEKPSHLPLNAGNPLAVMMAGGGKDLTAAVAQTMAQKVISYLQHELVFDIVTS